LNGTMVSAVVGFICNVVHPLFTEWHRLLVSPLSLLLLDNLQANLRHWQSVSTDNVSVLTAADSSDDSSPSNADQGDRHLLSVSGDIVPGRPHTVFSDGGDSSGTQTENVLRRASMPPLSATAITGVAVCRGSSPVVGSQQHVSSRRVYFLSSLAEDTAPVIAPPPSIPCSRQLNTTTELDFSRPQYSDEQNIVGKNGHTDVILTDKNICLPDSESRHCSAHAFQFSNSASTPVIYADDSTGSIGALWKGVSLKLPKFVGIRRGSAPVVCSTRLPAACATRRGSAPSTGAELIAVSLWTSKLPFDTELSSATDCHQPSAVLVESPHFSVGIDRLSLICVLTNNSTLKVPLECDAGLCSEKRRHSAHAVVINPARFVERRSSNPLLNLGAVGMPAT